MQLAQAAIVLHLGNDTVNKSEKIVLTLAHQHTNLSASEWFFDERGGEARVVLHIRGQSRP